MKGHSRHREALLAAAKGCVNGTLAEWPYLLAALRLNGHDCDPAERALGKREVAKEILNG